MTTITEETTVGWHKIGFYHRPKPGSTIETLDWDYINCLDHNAGGIVGYVVRQTFHEGELVEEDGVIGQDVAAFEGATSYGAAIDFAVEFRDEPGSYAVVDTLYRCGHRSD